MDDHPLAAVLLDAALGTFPESDWGVDILPGLEGLSAAVLSFTAHSFIATDLDGREVLAELKGGRYGGNSMHPAFIAWLAQRLDAHCYTPDVVLVTSHAQPDPTFRVVERPDLLTHPRAVMAKVYRRNVRCFSDMEGDNVLTIGLGICGRYEVSIEVDPAQRNRGLGRRLASAARSLVPEDEPLFAEVSPGNAASLRAFLAAGYTPIGSEVGLLSRAVVATRTR